MNDDEDVKWLHEFLNASAFGPPAEAIERAHEVLKRIVARRRSSNDPADPK